MSLRSLLGLLAVAALTGGCAVHADRGDEGDVDGDEAALKSPAHTFYRVRQDFRRCMYPLCGGIFYRQVNLEKTNCVGGGSADWCYAAESDWSAIPSIQGDAYADIAIVRATISKVTINGSRYGRFVATEGWRSITAVSPVEGSKLDPRFYLVKDNGIRCVTAPCYSTDALRLNTTYKTTLGGVDLSSVAGATPDQLDGVYGIMVNSGAIVFGSIKGGTLAGSAAYLKQSAPECTSDAQCAASSYGAAVRSAADCYCPMCPTPMSAARASENRAGWEKYCSSSKVSCPIPPCAPPPGPVACVEGACRYSVGADR